MSSRPSTRRRSRPGVARSRPPRREQLVLHGEAQIKAFSAAVTVEGLAAPMTEVRFCDARKWRFDYAWPAAKVALEVEGGIWVKGGGGHNRGKAFKDDLEKYNRATVLGWRVIRVLPEQLLTIETLAMLRALMIGDSLFRFEVRP